MKALKPYPHIIRAADVEAAQSTFCHPWNPKSEIRGTWLGHLAGLSRTGVSLGRLAPGKESFAYHAHHTEEEWLYILAGRGVALIDGEEYELRPGDFVAFPTPSVPHNMSNPFDEELVYLMGGENKPIEVADFPSLGRRMLKLQGQYTFHELGAEKPVFSQQRDDT
jgi:uncharacterized cupin superfamily protein